MENTERPWFEELTVTPLIERAVEELRAAIPADLPPGAIGIKFTCHADPYGDTDGYAERYSASIAYVESPTYQGDFEIEYTQQTAAWLLVSLVAHHQQHMSAAYGEIANNGDELITPELAAARTRFDEDVRRKLNIEVEGRSRPQRIGRKRNRLRLNASRVIGDSRLSARRPGERIGRQTTLFLERIRFVRGMGLLVPSEASAHGRFKIM